jgi:modulator of FtsH protease HflK
MSDSPEHPHDHDHEHGHDHDHAHDAPTAPGSLDAGSRALEAALQSSFTVVKITMAALLVVFAVSGVTTVGPQERAVILRFGRPLGTGPEQLLGPGFHWAYPYPIDEVVKIPVGEVQSVTSTVGWYASSAAQQAVTGGAPPTQSLNPATDGYELTADGNIIHARATLRYRITDPLAYVFDFVNATNAVQGVLNHALLYAATHSLADNTFTNNAGFREQVLTRMNEQIDELKLGITLEPSDIEVAVPGNVKADFDAVLAAGQDSSSAISAAQGTALATVRNAQAQANVLENAAEAARLSYVREVQADANSFSSQLPQYQANPELFRQRRLAETWQRILARAPDKFVIPFRASQEHSDLWLQISREPPRAKTGGAP